MTELEIRGAQPRPSRWRVELESWQTKYRSIKPAPPATPPPTPPATPPASCYERLVRIKRMDLLIQLCFHEYHFKTCNLFQFINDCKIF